MNEYTPLDVLWLTCYTHQPVCLGQIFTIAAGGFRLVTAMTSRDHDTGSQTQRYIISWEGHRASDRQQLEWAGASLFCCEVHDSAQQAASQAARQWNIVSIKLELLSQLVPQGFILVLVSLNHHLISPFYLLFWHCPHFCLFLERPGHRMPDVFNFDWGVKKVMWS